MRPAHFVGTAREDLVAFPEAAFRVIYVAKFEDAVCVLHAFQKKTRRTSQADMELAAARYKSIGAKA